MAEGVLVNLVIQNAEADEEFEVQAHPQSSIYTVKTLAAEQWPIPAVCQRLLIDGAVIDNAELIGRFRGRQHNIFVDIEKCLDGLHLCLQDASPQVRLAGVRAAEKVLQTDYDDTVAALEPVALHDSDDDVRRAAVDALASACKKGHGATLRLLCAALADHDADVRSSAGEALFAAAGVGDKVVCKGLREHLQCWRAIVRRTAARALGLLGERGSQADIKALIKSLEDFDPAVRRAALGALRRLAERGDAAAMATLGDRLGKAESDARAPLLMAIIATCTLDGDAAFAARVLPFVKDASAEVRAAAVEALTAVAPKAGAEGSRQATDALLDRLGEPPLPKPPPEEKPGDGDSDDESVEDEPPPPAEGAPPAPLIADESPAVRRAAVLGLGDLARFCEVQVLRALAKRLEDPSGDVRRAVAESYAKLSPKFGLNNPDGVRITSHLTPLKPFSDGKKFRCDDQSPECTREQEGLAVRWSCRETLYDQCRGCVNYYRVDKLALAEVLRRLERPSENIRLCTLQALAPLAPRGHFAIVSALVRLLTTAHSARVKHAAMETLSTLALPDEGEEPSEEDLDYFRVLWWEATTPIAPEVPLDEGPQSEANDWDEEDEDEEEDEEGEGDGGAEEENPEAAAAPAAFAAEMLRRADEELWELPAPEAFAQACAAARHAVLALTRAPLAETRLCALEALPWLARSGADTAAVASLAEAVTARLKDRSEAVRDLASELLRPRSADAEVGSRPPLPCGTVEPGLLSQTVWPLGNRTTSSLRRARRRRRKGRRTLADLSDDEDIQERALRTV